MNTKQALFLITLVLSAGLIVVSTPQQNTKSPYFVRRSFLPEHACHDLDAYVIEVKKSEEENIQHRVETSSDSIVWAEQILFYAEKQGVEISNFSFERNHKNILFHFCVAKNVQEKDIVAVLEQSGL